ncbi:MAG: glycosyltransferase family 4 protein [Alphaproteobacteria bacterium]|nr:glycosyltransferase family 4 protein [Alphaproteobacteria bacterium]
MTDRPRGPLMVFVSDRLSVLAAKGELIDRYYNPGDLFDEVHIVLCNDDRPDPAAIRHAVGRARLTIHNLPAGKTLFLKTLGWQTWLLGVYAEQAIDLARAIKPTLMRAHDAQLNAFCCWAIKRALGVPYVVSLHGNPDIDYRGRTHGVMEWLAAQASRKLEILSLHGADLVLPVYRPIVPYLEAIGVAHYEIAYNAVNGAHLRRKFDYALHDPVRIVAVGRQIPEKCPDNVIRAVAGIPNAILTVIGNGPIHDHLERAAADCGIGERCVFIKAMRNDELCRRLPEFDIWATHSVMWEISKSMIEAFLTALPVVFTRHPGQPTPELSDDICVLVDNTPEAYRAALERLIADRGLRARLGTTAYERAKANWAPEAAEARYVELYRRVIGS